MSKCGSSLMASNFYQNLDRICVLDSMLPYSIVMKYGYMMVKLQWDSQKKPFYMDRSIQKQDCIRCHCKLCHNKTTDTVMLDQRKSKRINITRLNMSNHKYLPDSRK